jgi:2-polyprenyl-6-hydroxyphenyl methylase / 3-demethylubiquinone-9 3-methyltransferase
MLAKRFGSGINLLCRKFSSVDDQEIARFQRLANEWYKTDGKYSLLHKMNPVRVGYISNTLSQFYKNEEWLPLANLEIADVGCGGGFLSQPLSRLGAKVCGVDATLENIEVAKAHKHSSGIEFIHSTAGNYSIYTKRIW